MFAFRSCINAVRLGMTTLRSASTVSPSNPGLVKTISETLGGARNFSMLNNRGAVAGSSYIVPSSIPAIANGNRFNLLQVSTPILNSVRSIIRIHFPRPRENKRLRNHGWKTRMSTPSGRRILMRRILKGRHSLCHM